VKAIISSTYDDNYLFFLPITTFLWNRIGVDVICFMPMARQGANVIGRMALIEETRKINGLRFSVYPFQSPEHKEATYAQCSRLYGACLDLPEDEVLITSDIDMALFKIPENAGGHIASFGYDLVPQNQLPICYISGDVKEWRRLFKINGKSYQECLDGILGHIEAEHFRGNYWGKDQEEAYNNILGGKGNAVLLPRARPGTQFASNRIDRDDAYYMDRLSPDIVDYHMHRPGFAYDNFEKILAVISYFYPYDDLTWVKEYQQAYKKLL